MRVLLDHATPSPRRLENATRTSRACRTAALPVAMCLLLSTPFTAGAGVLCDPEVVPEDQPDCVRRVGTELALVITQLDWLDGDGDLLVPNSRVGRASFHLAGEPQPFLFDVGGVYVNLLTDVGEGPVWSVRNLLLIYEDVSKVGGSNPSVLFQLPATGPVRELQAELVLTEQPLDEMPPALQPLPLPVQRQPYRTGGLVNGGSELANLPFAVTPWIGSAFFANALASVRVPEAQLPAVAEDTNGCSPGAVARSIRYMADLAGLEADSVDEIYLDLFSLMGTSLDEGTWVDDIVFGKDAYNQYKELPIDTRLVDWSAGALDDAMRVLNSGGDVEINVTWKPITDEDIDGWVDELLEDLEKQDAMRDKASEESPDVEQALDEALNDRQETQEEIEHLLDEILARAEEEERRWKERRRRRELRELEEALDEALAEAEQEDEEIARIIDDLLLALDSPGGHTAMVTRIVKLDDGSYEITYIDDPQQGDGEAENVETTIVVGPDGAFLGGQVDTLLLEQVVF